MSNFTIRAVGKIADDFGTYTGAAIEGDMTAVKALGRVYGRPVAIVPADLLDEAEKALEAYVKADGMVGQSNVTITQYDAAMEAAHTLALATLARIRGEKA